MVCVCAGERGGGGGGGAREGGEWGSGVNTFLAEVVKSGRDVLFDRREQLCGGETRIDVEFAIEEFSVDAS